jgi:hypothetical protein
MNHKKNMSNSYTHGSFAVQLSHPDPNAVYLKITDTLNFVCYEGNLQPSDFKKDFAIADQYAILQNCFEEDDEHYSVTLSPTSGNLKLKFVALIGGILHWELIIFVKEKILSNDGKLTLDFNRMEQKQEMAIQGLVKRCDLLDRRCKLLEDTLEKQTKEFFRVIDRIDVVLFPTNHISCPSLFPSAMPKISCEEITIDNAAKYNNMRFENLSVFYKLKKLKINGFTQKPDLTTLANETVTELELNCAGQPTFTSLTGFANSPCLTSLTVISSPGLTNVVSILKSKPHKIKTLKFQGCGGVNVVELQTYCQENKIFVALS